MTLRENIIDLIALIASPEKQYEYEEEVPIANVPQELLCMWFDDIYHPDRIDFKNSFNKQEIETLANFNQYFEERAKLVPQFEGVKGLQQNSKWLEIQSYANTLISEQGWNENL